MLRCLSNRQKQPYPQEYKNLILQVDKKELSPFPKENRNTKASRQ